MENFEFTCSCCSKVHQGVPSFGVDAPMYFYQVPENERDERTFLSSDTCVIDDKDFFIKGCLEMPVLGCDDLFSFNAWVSLSETNFFKFQDLLDVEEREHHEPMIGWFSTWIYPFEDTEKLIAKIHFRNNGIRPFLELQPTEHPLALAQKNGITKEKIQEIYEHYVHGSEK
jgi:hypothetical protein